MSYAALDSKDDDDDNAAGKTVVYTADTLITALNKREVFDVHKAAGLVRFLRQDAKWNDQQAVALLGHTHKIASSLNTFIADKGDQVQAHDLAAIFQQRSSQYKKEDFDFLNEAFHTISQLTSKYGGATSNTYNTATPAADCCIEGSMHCCCCCYSWMVPLAPAHK